MNLAIGINLCFPNGAPMFLHIFNVFKLNDYLRERIFEYSGNIINNSFFIYIVLCCVIFLSIKHTSNTSKQNVYSTRTSSVKNTNYIIQLYCSILKLLDNSIETNFHFSNYCGYQNGRDPIKKKKHVLCETKLFRLDWHRHINIDESSSLFK